MRHKSGGFPGSKDSNGNWCCGNDAGWVTDTLGRRVNQGLMYYDSDGVVRTLATEFINIPLNTAFPTAAPFPASCNFDQNNWPLGNQLKKLTLPNGLSYSFSYETWWDFANPTALNPYGEVSKVTLPTGGYIKYKWATIAGRDDGPEGQEPDVGCAPALDARVVVERRVSEDGVTENVWTYAYSGATTTVTDPLGNAEIHTFAGPKLSETQVEYRKPDGTPLRRVNTDWAWDTGPVRTDFFQNWAPYTVLGERNPRVIRTTTTLLDTNQVTKSETDYGDCYSYTFDLTSYMDCRDNPTQTREYAYGTGVPGALVRYSTFSYLHNAISAYETAHIWNRATDRRAFDAAGALKAHTQFSYDTTALTQTTGVPQHDYVAYPYTNAIRGNVTEVKRWLNTTGGWLTTTNYFNDVGNLIQTTDSGGHTITFSYTDNFTDGVNRNSQGYVTQVTYPITGGASHIERKQYYWFTGLAAAQCGQNFPSASPCTNTYAPPQPDYAKFTYDLLGRPLTVVQAGNGQTTFAFTEPATPTPANPILVSSTTKITGTMNLVNTAVVDGLGRVKQTQLNSDPQGVTYTDTTYDALGRNATVSNPYRNMSESTYGITRFCYDALGRVRKVTPPDGTPPAPDCSGGSNLVTTDFLGNTVTVTDQAGKQRKSYTDALGRLVQVDEPNPTLATPAVTTYTYDVLDNLLTVIQSGSRQRTFAYNSLSQLTSATNPESGATSYTFDSDGNVLRKTDARGIYIDHFYDTLHRLKEKNYSDTAQSKDVEYFYDQTTYNGLTIAYGIGRRTGMTDKVGGVTAWSFGVDGATLTERRTISGITKTISYAYNLDGSLATLTYPSGRMISYAYNAAARPSAAQDIATGINYATGAVYAPHGALASLTNGASLVSTIFYNIRLQPCRMHARSSGTAPANCSDTAQIGNILDFSYDFVDAIGNNGNVDAIANNRFPGRSQSYTYDELNRIKTAQSAAASGADCWGLQFGYDIWANLLSAAVTKCTAPALNLTVNTSNRITNTGFTYDAAGNLTADGSYTYQWDAESRMKSLNTTSVLYTYDGDGRRVKKSTGKLYWNNLAGDSIAESDLAGNLTDEFIFLGGKRIARRKVATGEVNYYFADHLGNSRVVTNSSGAILDDADFYPFGGERVVTSTSGNTYKFTGKERDTESNLDYFGERYYQSTLGRFLTTDPAGVDSRPQNPQSWNKYVYGLNHPLRYLDPNGLWTEATHDEIIDTVFGNILSREQRSILKSASRIVDLNQGPESAIFHGMSVPGQEPFLGAMASANEVDRLLRQAADNQDWYERGGGRGWSGYGLYLFGQALHLETDSVAPEHEGSYQWRGLYGVRNLAHAVRHGVRESVQGLSAHQRIAAENKAHMLWNRFMADVGQKRMRERERMRKRLEEEGKLQKKTTRRKRRAS